VNQQTSDPQIISIVSGYKISFLKTLFLKTQPFAKTLGQEVLLISQELNELLQKGPYKRSLLPETIFTAEGRVTFITNVARVALIFRAN